MLMDKTCGVEEMAPVGQLHVSYPNLAEITLTYHHPIATDEQTKKRGSLGEIADK
jgi:hypothetical protein